MTIDGALAVCGMGVCFVVGLLLGALAEQCKWERRIKGRARPKKSVYLDLDKYQ